MNWFGSFTFGKDPSLKYSVLLQQGITIRNPVPIIRRNCIHQPGRNLAKASSYFNHLWRARDSAERLPAREKKNSEEVIKNIDSKCSETVSKSESIKVGWQRRKSISNMQRLNVQERTPDLEILHQTLWQSCIFWAGIEHSLSGTCRQFPRSIAGSNKPVIDIGWRN